MLLATVPSSSAAANVRLKVEGLSGAGKTFAHSFLTTIQSDEVIADRRRFRARS